MKRHPLGGPTAAGEVLELWQKHWNFNMRGVHREISEPEHVGELTCAALGGRIEPGARKPYTGASCKYRHARSERRDGALHVALPAAACDGVKMQSRAHVYTCVNVHKGV